MKDLSRLDPLVTMIADRARAELGEARATEVRIEALLAALRGDRARQGADARTGADLAARFNYARWIDLRERELLSQLAAARAVTFAAEARMRMAYGRQIALGALGQRARREARRQSIRRADYAS